MFSARCRREELFLCKASHKEGADSRDDPDDQQLECLLQSAGGSTAQDNGRCGQIRRNDSQTEDDPREGAVHDVESQPALPKPVLAVKSYRTACACVSGSPICQALVACVQPDSIEAKMLAVV